MSTDNTPAPQVEIQLPELPFVQRWRTTGWGSSGIIEDSEGEYVDYDDHVAAMRAYAQAALNARAGGDGGMVERMYQALWFAQPFIAYAAKNAENPRLAKECLTAMNASIEEYRALASQAVGVKS